MSLLLELTLGTGQNNSVLCGTMKNVPPLLLWGVDMEKAHIFPTSILFGRIHTQLLIYHYYFCPIIQIKNKAHSHSSLTTFWTRVCVFSLTDISQHLFKTKPWNKWPAVPCSVDMGNQMNHDINLELSVMLHSLLQLLPWNGWNWDRGLKGPVDH